ncbi:PepSY-associated TM helix domain-containing protein [Planctobacterium marinum]|uniref:Membrane protein n=1 Tax=Planctobacterium marinum TaxID=1631968 RepID=A0AA48HV85_9ALTE|nr:membrane protein [Planctobacterium marinum]
MRKKLFKWHSMSALVAFIPLMLISITGSILVFKVEIDNLLRPAQMQVQVASDAQRQPMDTLIAQVEKSHPNYLLGSWEIFDDKSRSDTAYLIEKSSGDWFKMYIDQYHNTPLSQPVSVTHDLTDWLLSLHFTFLLGVAGTALGFVFALLLLYLGISGIVLYRQFWKKLFTLRVKAASRIFYSDVHKFIGITSSPVLIILAFTGAWWNMSEVLHETIEHGAEEHQVLQQPIYAQHLNFEAMRQQSTQQITDFRATYMVFPFEEERHITFFGEVPTSNPLTSQYASTVTWHRDTGELVHKSDVRNAGFMHVFVDSFRKLHFGYFGGPTTKIIWCILGLSPIWLALTGLYFYWFRKRKQTKKVRVSSTLSQQQV